MIARSQTRGPLELSWDELREQVGRCQEGLTALGYGSGDRVVGYLPNIPEAVVAMLAATGLGAVWASCPPEFGTRSVIDRFGQLDPSVLISVSGYRYGSKLIDRRDEVEQIRALLPSLRAVVDVPYSGQSDTGVVGVGGSPGGRRSTELRAASFRPPVVRSLLLRDDGPPEGHRPWPRGDPPRAPEGSGPSAGSRSPSDRFFWFSTTGWMMWNFLVSGLVAGSAIVLFDGDPGHPDLSCLWTLAAETGITVFGVSAPYLMSCRKQSVMVPRTVIRSVGSTGAPLPADGFPMGLRPAPRGLVDLDQRRHGRVHRFRRWIAMASGHRRRDLVPLPGRSGIGLRCLWEPGRGRGGGAGGDGAPAIDASRLLG